MKLKVAIANPSDAEYLKPLNVDIVYVSNSLTDLRDNLSSARNRLSSKQNLESSIVSSFVDFESNTVVLGVNKNHVNSVRYELADFEFSESIQIEAKDGLPTLSTGYVRGGDGTRNLTWQVNPGVDVAPCSVGASVEDGFVTAGHCGLENDAIGDSDDDPLGTTEGSAFDWFNPFIDAGYVETSTGWTPIAQVNGYTDGNFSVSAEWAGMIESPVNSTVCRYGQTSGGPHCGTVNQLNLDQVFQIGANINQTILDVTRVSGSCSDDGDSGGTWVGGTGQIQGVNIGGSTVNTCPTSTTWTYYQPIKDVVDEFDVTMLTSHGSSAPTITSVSCPNMAISGQGLYQCLVKKVDSQGEVGIQWKTSTGASSTGLWVMDDCTSLQMVTVTLKATNPYGTTTKNYSFRCPSGPIQ